jgi:hypothetical protein
MGPFSEMKQLERKASVLALLQQNNLSEWARDYWGLVLDRITLDEARYNDRVVQLYKDRERQKGWINYE